MKTGNILFLISCMFTYSWLADGLPKSDNVEFYDVDLDDPDNSTSPNVSTTPILATTTPILTTAAPILTTTAAPPKFILTITVTYKEGKLPTVLENFKKDFINAIFQILNGNSSYNAYDSMDAVPIQDIKKEDIVIENVTPVGNAYKVEFYIKDSTGEPLEEKQLNEYAEKINRESETLKKELGSESVSKVEVVDRAPTTSSPGGDDGGLPGWAIALIVIFVIALLAGIFAAVYFYKKKKEKHDTNYTTTYSSLSRNRKSDVISNRPVSQAYSNPAYDRSTTALDSSGTNF